MRFRLGAALLVGLLALGSPGAAQTRSPVRFTPAGPVWGDASGSGQASVAASAPAVHTPAALARDSTRGRGVTRAEAMLLGAVIGGVALLPVGIRVFRRTQGSPNCLSPFCALPLLGPPLAGAGAGALIGDLIYIHLPDGPPEGGVR